jgi:membrane-bound lytic murein transglycosylase B
MRGSWAGAVGQMQFMPSVYLKHATDADGDHKADLWHSTSDALTSAAVYLRAAGWSANQPWIQQVTLPSSFDYAIADGKTEMPLGQVQALGVKPVSGTWLASDNNNITLILPAGFEGPAFATWANFKVIKRWNHSNNYAISVGLLAHRIANKGQPILTIPSNEKPWSRTFITQLQQTLTQAGYDTGGADGWFGSRSIQALRNFQQAHQLPADGYPNRKTLVLLNLTP